MNESRSPVGAPSSRHGAPERPSSDAIDGRVPRSWVEPATCSEVASAVDAVRGDGEALVVVGGTTMLAAGNPPRRLDVCLSTRKLVDVLEPEPADMTVVVQAGVSFATLSEALARNGQRIALDPFDPERATVGGVLATNVTGGLAHGFGQPRDLVLGMTVVDGRARTLRVGGRVVKNVAGYDLVRLFTGSYGTLGVIVEATLRTHPLPERVATLAFRFASWEQAEHARAGVLAASLPLAALDFEAGTSGIAGTLVARIEGTDREIEAQRRILVALCRVAAEEGSVVASPVHPTASDTVVLRVGVAPAAVLHVARDVVRERGSTVRVAARLGDGCMRVCATLDDAPEAIALARLVRAAALRHGGAAFVERLWPGAKTEVDAWGDPPASIALMREIKRRFDPDAVLAPGRFVGGI